MNAPFFGAGAAFMVILAVEWYIGMLGPALVLTLASIDCIVNGK